MVNNTILVRFINILLGYSLVAYQITALQYPCFDLTEDLGFASQPHGLYIQPPPLKLLFFILSVAGDLVYGSSPLVSF
jgi:hypothetical protein